MKKVLYISSRTGLAEPLGISQVLSYILELSKNNKIYIISSEKRIDLENELNIKKIKSLLKKNNIIWHYTIFKYGKKSVPITILNHVLIAMFFCMKYKIDIIHCRSYISNYVGIIVKVLFSN